MPGCKETTIGRLRPWLAEFIVAPRPAYQVNAGAEASLSLVVSNLGAFCAKIPYSDTSILGNTS